MKRELLSPAGSFEALKQAVHAGADAVYIGGKRFGARAFAANFSESELKEAIFYCHLYGVKLYVTVNTMIYERELEEVLEYVSFLYQNHVDAVIMADLGLMKLCHERFPDLEIHASTQTHTHNVEQISLLQKIGVKRVVLARELSLEEINQFPKDIEIEVFIHGALCISYSGQCLFSSLLMDRSGNRGECAQICRLPFTLLRNGASVATKGQYLLSTRDLNTTSNFSKLLDSSITSFKIEGRMKSPAYVFHVTKVYRNLIDQYEKTGQCDISKNDFKKLVLLFNRKFTEGKINGKTGFDFVNQETSNHQGIFLGDVLEITKKKIKIHLQEDLHQEDGIRFLEEEKGLIVNYLYNEKGLLINSASKGDIVFIDNKIGIVKSKTVMKTMDSVLEKEILNMPSKKIFVTIDATLDLEKGFSLRLSDGTFQVEVQKLIVFEARKAPITKEKVKELLGRLGNTPFELTEISIHMQDNLFVNIRDINEIRREAVDALIQRRITREDVKVIDVEKRPSILENNEIQIFASVKTEEQLKTLLSLPIHGIYVDDYLLYQKYRSSKIFYRTNRVQHYIKAKDANQVLVGESGSLSLYQDGLCHTDYFFNVANHAAADLLIMEGAQKICLSPEMKKEDYEYLLKQYPQNNMLEMIIYGRLEVMVLNHCILKTNVNHDTICKVCTSNDAYALEDRNHSIYPIYTDEFHHTHIYYHRPINLVRDAYDYYKVGIRSFRFDFLDETKKEMIELVEMLQTNLQI